MSVAKTFTKDPDAVLDYRLDWSKWLGTDTITESEWTVPEGITKTDEDFTGTTTLIWLEGGTVKQTYQLTNHITTAAGREDDRTIAVKIAER